MRSLPILAILLGLAGLLPFVALSFGAALQPGGIVSAELSSRALPGLSAYAAVILAFLGGVHWGIGLEAGAGQTVAAQRARFGLGVLPSLIGWAGLLVTFVGLALPGLAIQAAGFIATTIVEARGARAGLVPRGYMALRWVLSTGVILCLVSVILVLTFGGHIVI